MGASEFVTVARGRNAAEAFSRAVEDARHMHGHGGYTGTIAEKSEFVKIDRASASVSESCDIAWELIDQDDRRIRDKWGPAGCLYAGRDDSGSKTYVFFGVASS